MKKWLKSEYRTWVQYRIYPPSVSLKCQFSCTSEELLRIDELLSAIRKLQKIPDEGKLEKLAEVLGEIDEDHDGSIRIDTVLKVSAQLFSRAAYRRARGLYDYFLTRR